MLRRGVVETPEFPFSEGSEVFIRTATHYWFGILVTIGPDYLELKKASRKNAPRVVVTGLGELARRPEFEPVPGHHIIMRTTIVDISRRNCKFLRVLRPKLR